MPNSDFDLIPVDSSLWHWSKSSICLGWGMFRKKDTKIMLAVQEPRIASVVGRVDVCLVSVPASWCGHATNTMEAAVGR